MINLLGTLDLWRVVGEILVHGETKVEHAALVHALVRLDGQGEVEDVVRVGEGHFHGISEGEFLEVYQQGASVGMHRQDWCSQGEASVEMVE